MCVGFIGFCRNAELVVRFLYAICTFAIMTKQVSEPADNVKVTNGNRIVIPPVVVEELNLKVGDRVGWFKIGGMWVVKKLKLVADE